MIILRSIIGFTIPIPVILIPIVWLLWSAGSYWDKTAAIKDAVEHRVTELVAGAELTALREEVKAEKLRADLQQQITARQIEMRIATEAASRNYQEDLNREEKQSQDLQKRLDEMLQTDDTGIGVVTPELLDKLPDR